MKTLLTAFLILSGFISAISQSHPVTEKTLLWRVTGKGLTQPSYLFGTMHLTDEKLFNFSDSLLEAIKTTDGFAIEVDPDELMVVMMEDMFNDIKKTQLLKDVVSPKAFKKYAPGLAKRLKKDAEEITVKDVIKEENKWMNEAYKKGSMPTFVDLWLYDLARKQGKVVGGIEDVEDQLGLIESLFTEQDLEMLTADYSSFQKSRLKEMVDLYVNEDIASIDNFMNTYSADKKDALLIKRNVKMASRMDSLSALRTMVFAVGAAHLPGDSGVINLLRKRGFEVLPVYGSKKIAGKTYKVDPKPLKWVKFKDANGLYEIEMPGKAAQVKMYGLVEMRLNINLFNSSGYMTMAVPSSKGETNPDSILLIMGRQMLSDRKLKQGKPLELNGIKGREFIADTDEGYKKAQIYVNDKTVYLACAFYMKENELESEDAKRFFNSFSIARVAETNETWLPFKNVVPGIEAFTPVKMERNKQIESQMKEENWQAAAYTGIDISSGAYFMLMTKATEHDSYIPNDSAFLAAISQNARSRAERMDEDTITFTNGKYVLNQNGIYSENHVRFYSKSVVNGNRVTTFLALSEDKPQSNKVTEKAVRTLAITQVPLTTWSTNHTKENHFKTWTPGPLIKHFDASSDSLVSFNSRDSNSSYVFSVIPVALDTTKWFSSKKHFWEKMLKEDTDDDSAVYKHFFSNNGIEGYDILYALKNNSGKVKRSRKILHGDSLYTLFTAIPVADTSNKDIERFFTDFTFTKPAPPSTLFTSRAASFLQQLQKPDSANAEKIFYKVSEDLFSSEDIPLLRNAMLLHYDWDSSFYTNVQYKIGNALVNLDDSSLADFLVENYAKSNNREDDEQSALLQFIASKPTHSNLDFALKGLLKLGDTTRILNTVVYLLDDSLPLVPGVLPDILQLLAKPNMIDAALGVLKNLVDSNIVQPSQLLPYEKAIIAFGEKQLATQQKGEDKTSPAYLLESVAPIAGYLKTPASVEYLNKLVACKQNNIKSQGLVGLLQAGASLPQGLVSKLASDITQHNNVYKMLLQFNKQSLFPPAQLNQQQFAQSEIYEYLVSEEEVEVAPESIVYVDKKTTILSGETTNVFFFRFRSEKENYLAAIAFPPEEQQFESLDLGSSVYWEAAFTQKRKDEQIAALLKQMGDD